MVNNPVFEFDTLDGCCSLHYQGKESCKVQTLQLMKKLLYDEKNGSGSLASVSGQVWKDANGNNWQDVNERTMGNGVPGVMVDLYECPPSSSKNSYPPNFRNDRWVTKTQTSLDGSYLLREIAPGRYYVQVTPPEGYHLSNNHPWRDDEFDSDFNGEGKSKCVDFATTGVRDVTFDAGLIPDDDVLMEDVGVGGPLVETKMELVSAAAAANDEVEQEDLRPSQDDRTSKEEEHQAQQQKVGTMASSYSAAMHTKSRTSNSPERSNSGNNNNAAQQLDDDIEPPSSSTAVHTKSFLRSSSYSNTGIAPSTHSTVMVPIQPTDDATIHSNEGIMFVGGTGELLVGPQSSWHNDILLKFDVTPFALTERRDYRAANKAVLRMYSLTSSPSGGVVHFASSNIWDEENVTWSTAPEAGHVLATIGQTRPNLWVEVDVTGMLLTDDGIATLRITSETNNHSWVAKYSSKENGEGHPAPELRVFF